MSGLCHGGPLSANRIHRPFSLAGAPVLLWKMPLKVAGVMQTACHLDHIAAAAVEDKMPGFFYARAAHLAAALREMVET